MMKYCIYLLSLALFSGNAAFCQENTASQKVVAGAGRMHVYLPLLKGKKVAVFANQTSNIFLVKWTYRFLK